MGRTAHSCAGESHTLTPLSDLLLINPRAGTGAPSPDDLAAAARARGIEPHVLADGEDAARIARAATADVIGIAGGDGSLGPVAEVALERDVPFVCVPYGTRNHFARDVGLDRADPIGALRAFEGTERQIDIGWADGRLFLNNVSLGLYARLVHRRERHRRRREAFARLRAWAILLTHRTPLGITVDGEPAQTQLVLVANNAYDTNLPTIGARERLDEGLLHLYGLGLDPPERAAERFVVDAEAGRLEAALDGRPDVLRTPIEFRIEPRALRVLVPPREGGWQHRRIVRERELVCGGKLIRLEPTQLDEVVAGLSVA
jgi:diacylglycerol kinase family enzyme